MYYALQIEVAEEMVELLQAALDDTNPMGLEVRDHSLKPLPNAAPLAAGRILVLAYYEDEHQANQAADGVRQQIPEALTKLDSVAPEDWSETWKQHVRAVRVGRIWVGPPWELHTAGDATVKLVIEPGMAFGTGDHPTTALCLQELDKLLEQRAGASLLDVGTGTGVLAIAGRLLGASRVVGNDIDPVALRVARENAQQNQATDIDFTERPLERIASRFDIVVANLYSSVICQLAGRLAAHLAPGGALLVTGILASQADEVAQALEREGLLAPQKLIFGEWVLLSYGLMK